MYQLPHPELLSTRVPEAMKRQLRETESKVFQTGFSDSRKDWWKEDLDHRAVLVKRFPKHIVHISQRDPRTHLERHTIYSVIFRRIPNVISANAQKSQWLHEEGILKVEKTGYQKQQKLWDTTRADHKVLNEENESRLHQNAVLV